MPAQRTQQALSTSEGVEKSASPHPMQDVLSGAYEYRELQRGDIVRGTIISASPSAVVIDVGSKSEGILWERELAQMGPEDWKNLRVGKQVWVYVLQLEDNYGNMVLSIAQAGQEADWQTAQELFDRGEVFQARAISANKGGLIVPLGQVQGFVPASQLLPITDQDNARPGGMPWDCKVGQELWLSVIELDRERNRLILSERVAAQQRRRQEKDRLLDEVKEGDILRGCVTSLADFGAFVNLGGADGLIHVSEIAWERVSHPGEVLQVGDEVEVYVLRVDRKRRRIGLSLKRLRPEPWSIVNEQYTVGQVVQATITKLVSFGCFARLNGGIEGLIHISELSERMIQHPREVVAEGQEVLARIIHIDGERRRLGLSLKQVDNPEQILPDVDLERKLDQDQLDD